MDFCCLRKEKNFSHPVFPEIDSDTHTYIDDCIECVVATAQKESEIYEQQIRRIMIFYGTQRD